MSSSIPRTAARRIAITIAAFTLAAAAAHAQTAAVHVPGAVSVTNTPGGSSVVVNGHVVNAASGAGAVAETNVGSRRSVVRGQAGQTSVVTVDGNGTTVQTVTTSPAAGTAARTAGSAAGADFINADLTNRSFANARLAGRKFINTNLSGANLRGADLRGAEFVNVDLDGADLSGANLTGAKLVNTDLAGARTDGAIWTDGRKCAGHC